MSRRLLRWLRYALLASASLAAGAAQAHRLDEWLQATIVHLEPGELSLDVRIAPGAALAMRSIAEIDADGDGRFSAAEQAAFAERIHREFDVSIDGRPWASRLRVSSFPEPAQIRDGTGDVMLQFSGPVSPGVGAHRLRIASAHPREGAAYMINALQPQAETLRSLRQDRSADQSTYELDFTVASAASAASRPEAIAGNSAVATAWTFFLQGMRHILTGYDHLLFAAALVLAVRSFKELLLVVTAFTLAHTITSALAVFGLVHVPSSLVEPAISASIVFVALQNAFWPAQSGGNGRLVAAFFFGLFHGLGFAGGLLDVLQEMPMNAVAIALLGFMLGVEAGQQCIVVPLFLLSSRYRSGTRPDPGPKTQRLGVVRRCASGAIAASGGWYLVQALALSR
jgi:hypothetical protein